MPYTTTILAILPYSIGGRLTIKSLIDGFIKLGCNVLIFDELEEKEQSFEDKIKHNNPDFLLGYDYSAIIHKEKQKLSVKTINYFSDVLDSPVAGVYWQEYFDFLKQKDNYTFYWDKKLTEKLKKEINNIFYLPHVVNTNIYKPYNIEKSKDIMFAGRLDYNDRLNIFLNLAKHFPDKKIAWYAINKHYESALNSCITEKDRKTIKESYCGFISTEKQMAQKLNEAKMIVNFHSQGVSNINYRTFQAMASGTLVISDFRQEMEEMFDYKNELVIYNSLNDMYEKISFYLKNFSESLPITKNAVKRIKNDFAAHQGAKQILDTILHEQRIDWQ